ncbi:MAG: DUF3048 domain-containing protein [Candidatus Saccharibacteria bacterium]|nr:DUF3048 domain-containing protein [Candidatus Saccharibacteria bacterium]
MEEQTPQHEPRAGNTNGHIPHRNKWLAKWHELIAPWQRLDLKYRVLILLAIGVFLVAATSAALRVIIKEPEPIVPAYIPPPEEPEPTTAPSPLTGVEVSIAKTKLPVTGVMIENSPEARPQTGLEQAGVVFEALAEGGITRFLALYQESQPETIGPVRSARTHYLDFLAPFDAAIAHAGGSARALDEIRRQGIKDLDQAHHPNYYQRTNNRYSPHNLYTNRKQLLQLHKEKGFTSSKFDGYARKEADPAKKPSATKINIDVSSFNYNSSYTYHKKSNSYKRNMANKPHTDEKSGKQITPEVVIALETSYRKDGIYSIYGVTGKGKVTVFQDGKATVGTWSKKNRKSPYVFKAKDGELLALNPGQTWIAMVTAGDISFSK